MNYKLLIVLILFGCQAYGQWSWLGQLRTRSKFGDGAGTLRLKTYDPALFISQRARITSGFKSSILQFQASIQDVRVWGQDTPTISSSDGSRLGIHEAWAYLQLNILL